MPNISSGQADPSRGDTAGRGPRRLKSAVKESARQLSVQLSMLNAQVSAHLKLKEVDLLCLDVITRYEPISPSTLARRAGLHPATLTGILDRLERGGFINRERDSADRRAVLIRARRERGAEIYRLYGGMNAAMDGILGRYDDAELELLADFLRRTVEAGHTATVALAAD
jgi:DNA-binding MarR family transcriptional regulator